MMFEKFEKDKPLKVIAKNFRIEEVVKKDFLNFLKKKYSEDYDIRIRRLEIVLIVKEKAEKERFLKEKLEENEKRESKEDEKVIEIPVLLSIPAESLGFYHRHDTDYESKKVVIEASKENILEKLFGEK